MPREGHDLFGSIGRLFVVFQSTCPARGTTYTNNEVDDQHDISIHVPREGHD